MKVHFRVLDVETSGMEPTDCIVEIGYVDVLFDTETLVYEVGPNVSKLYSPRKPMDAEVISVHHITNEDVAGLPRCEIADMRAVVTEGGPDFMVAHNWSFEGQYFTPTLLDGIRPICSYKAALRLLPEAKRHNLQYLRYHLNLPVDRERAQPPHRAAPDAYVTAHLLGYFLQHHRVRELVEITMQPRYFAVCPLANHKDKPWDQVPGDYLRWMTGPNDLDPDLKATARMELDRRAGQ